MNNAWVGLSWRQAFSPSNTPNSRALDAVPALITEQPQRPSLRAVSTCRRSSGRFRGRVTGPCSHQRYSTAVEMRNGGR